MRSILFLLMILAPAMSPLIAQKQLPPSIEPYAVNWGYSVKLMFEAAGYEVPGPKANFEFKREVNPRSSELQLDSTVTYYGYEEPSEDSIPLFKNVYGYFPDEGLEVMTEYLRDIDHWVPLSRTGLFTDELGRLVDAVSQVYDDAAGGFIPDSEIQFFPHENSLTEADSFFVSGWAPELNKMHRLFSVWNTFDDQGRLKESLSSTELFEFPIVFIDRYSYNNDDELIGIESNLLEGGEEIPGSREIFFYEDHKLVASIVSVSDGPNGFIDESKIEYSYTLTGKEEIVTSHVLDLENSEWILSHILWYEYDEADRVIVREESTLMGDGRWDRTADAYDYFIDEELAVHTTYFFDFLTGDWTFNDKTYYYYNEGTTAYEPIHPRDIEALQMWPNPASGNVQFQLDGISLLQVFGSTGQLVKQYELNGGECNLDVSALPSGIYYVKAKANEMDYTGKLVVQQ